MPHGRLRWQASSYKDAYTPSFFVSTHSLPAKAFLMALHAPRPSSLASQLLQKRVHTIIFCVHTFLAGESVFDGAACPTTVFAGKPAPTKTRTHHHFLCPHIPCRRKRF